MHPTEVPWSAGGGQADHWAHVLLILHNVVTHQEVAAPGPDSPDAGRPG